MEDIMRGTTILMVRTRTGLVTRGGPSVRSMRVGDWQLITDDFEVGESASIGRSTAIERDPITYVLEKFAYGTEVFALVGPPGVIAGSAPGLVGGGRVSVWVEPDEGVVALGLGNDDVHERTGWLSLPAGTAVGWGPSGPEVFCDLKAGAARLWDASDWWSWVEERYPAA